MIRPCEHIRSRLRARLRDTRGFMLAEQLVSIVFIGLLCVMVAAGLTAAMSAYASITAQTKADALLAQAVERVSDEMAFALSVESGDAPKKDPLFVSGSRNELGMLASDSRGIWFQADSANHVLLVPAQDGFVPSLKDVVYYRIASSEGAVPADTWTYRIEVTSPSGEVLAQTASDEPMRVRRIG